MLKQITIFRFSMSMLVLALAMPLPLARGQNLNMQLVSQIGGATLDVAAKGHYAYIGEGNKFQVVDISTTHTTTSLIQQPTAVGTVFLPEVIQGIALSPTNNLAFAADGFSGLQVIDISNPIAPKLVGSLVTTSTNLAGTTITTKVQDVVSSDSLAYLADDQGGLQIVNVATPSAPTLLASLNYNPGSTLQASSIAILGQTVYVGDQGTVQIIDVSNPAAPKAVTLYNTLNQVNDLATTAGLLLIADNAGGLQTLNVSNPALPKWLSTFNTRQGNTMGVAIAGQLAYLAIGQNGLEIVNLADPTNPQLVSTIQVPGSAQKVALAINHQALIASKSNGLQIVDVSIPIAPALSTGYPSVGDLTGVAVCDGLAYVTNGFGGLQVIDVSNPSNPTLDGSIATPGYAAGVVLHDQLAYVADQTHGLQIIDISNSNTLSLVGSYNNAPSITTSLVHGPHNNYVYLTDYSTDSDGEITGKLKIIDTSNPAHPKLAGSCTATNHIPWSVSFRNNLAYVACWMTNSDGTHDSFIQVVDVNEPTTPTLLGKRLTHQDLAVDITAVNHYVYSADIYTGLRVINIADPNNPKRAGYYGALNEDAMIDGNFSTQSITVTDGLAYLGMGAKVTILNLHGQTKPINPTLRGSFTTVGFVTGVAVANGLIYVADGEGGFYILQSTEPPLTVTDISRDDFSPDYLQPYKRVYTDRSYVFTPPIPSYLQDQLYIQTANDDKKKVDNDNDFLSFTVDKPVTVYVGLDDRITSTPLWLLDWNKTSDTLTTTDADSPGHQLYTKAFSQGRISLGGNRNSDTTKKPSFYTVVLVPK